MRYLIIFKNKTAFYTKWYEYDNHYSDEMTCVVDRLKDLISFDGITWIEIEDDHLSTSCLMAFA